MHPHRSSALDGAAATLTVARTRGVAVPLSWSWSHHPQGRAWAAASARGDTLGRTPYSRQFSVSGFAKTYTGKPKAAVQAAQIASGDALHSQCIARARVRRLIAMRARDTQTDSHGGGRAH